MSERSREELLEMLQQISKTRNVERKNQLIDRINGDEAQQDASTNKLSK
jgi:hypothetical protein